MTDKGEGTPLEKGNGDKARTVDAPTHKGIDTSNLDPAVSPREDFYRYACGGWMEKHPLTAEYSRFGTFDLLREQARTQLKDLIMGLSESPAAKEKGTVAQKVSDLYAMGMDEERLNREGAAPVLPLVEKIESWPIDDLESLVGWLHLGVTSSLFGTGVGPDPADSGRNIMHIGEAGLGLGDRDYYLEDNEGNRRIMEAYQKYVKKLMSLIGMDREAAERVWKNVIDIETEFARHKMTREQRRDPLLHYNMRSYDELKEAYGAIDWDKYFAAIGVGGLREANIVSTGFMDFLNGYLPGLGERQLKDYMIFELVSDSTGVLGHEFEDASFEMYGRVMSGKEEQEPRWKRAMTIPNSMLGEAVGQLYVEKYFPTGSKEYMVGLVENLRKALGKHISALEWMTDATKARALDKLAAMKVKIGYPDRWKDYSDITIDPARSYLANVFDASVWYARDNYSKLGKTVDRDEWHMSPQTVNAYYSPVNNEICFPAGILQPPYFDVNADDAVNYGAIGVVIGHEMTHGFDDQGRQYDKEGNLNEWWEPSDADRFKLLAERLVSQFDAIEVAPGVHANGRYTLGENIADQGGLRVAYTAWRDAVAGKPTAADRGDGMTPEQRFYLSYANVWAGNIRPEEILVRTKTDPHSLGRLRVNATLSNLAPFFEAFGIVEGDAMFRPGQERTVIW